MKLSLTLRQKHEVTNLSEWCRRADRPLYMKDAFIGFRCHVINLCLIPCKKHYRKCCRGRLLHDINMTDSPNLEFYYSVWISLTSSWHTPFCNPVGRWKFCAKYQAKYPISRAVSGNITHLSFLLRTLIRHTFSSTMDVFGFGVADSFQYFSHHYLKHCSTPTSSLP